MYVVFVGPPSTGKSQAIEVGVTASLHAISTAQDEEPKILKMAKNDGDNASGDMTSLCHMFCGEISSTYTTQKKRETEAGCAFSILRATQPGLAAYLWTILDVGNGMIERLVIHIPDCLRPSPTATRQERQKIIDNIVEACYNHENYLAISGFLLYQGKKTKNYKELGPAKLPCYKRVLLYPTSL